MPGSQKKKAEPGPPSSHSPSFAMKRQESSQRFVDSCPNESPNQWSRALGETAPVDSRRRPAPGRGCIGAVMQARISQ